jgi:hypothetical protein
VTDDITRYDDVEAYCDRLSYAPGDTVELNTCCRTARYDVVVARWGGEPVWRAERLAGVEHATPADADAHGCGWPVAVTIPVDASWRSGFYLVTLTAHGGRADRAVGHAGFVVRAAPDAAPADVLFVLATNTWNAYNSWGGCSLYTGGTHVSFDRPFGRGLLVRAHVERDDRKARPRRRGEEPDVDGEAYQTWRNANGYAGFAGSAGWHTYERRFAQWAERVGVTLDYAVSSDLADHPEVPSRHRCLVSVGHDEYWEAGQRAAVEAHVRGGGNFASFSGNTMFWQVRLADNGRTMVGYKYAAHRDDPVVGTSAQATMSGMWGDPLVGRPEATFLGAGSAWGLYNRFGLATPRGSGAFTVYRHDHWLFEGTGLRYGDLLGADDAVVGYETVGCRIAFDDLQLPIAAGGDSTPPGTEVVAFTPSSNLAFGEYPKSISALNDQGDLEFIAERIHGGLDSVALARARYGNAVMVVCRPFGADGGEVVTIGTTDWVFGLGDAQVARVTRNVVDRFAVP